MTPSKSEMFLERLRAGIENLERLCAEMEKVEIETEESEIESEVEVKQESENETEEAKQESEEEFENQNKFHNVVLGARCESYCGEEKYLEVTLENVDVDSIREEIAKGLFDDDLFDDSYLQEEGWYPVDTIEIIEQW